MNRKSRCFSLVEALVALMLFSLVIGALFGLFYHNVRFSKELKKLKVNSEGLHQAHARLLYIFSNLELQTSPHTFYSLKKDLIFMFNNQLDREEGFSDIILA